MRRLLFLVVLGWTAPLQGQRIDSLRAGIEHPAATFSTTTADVAVVVSEPPRDGLSFTVMAASGLAFAAAGIAVGGFAGYSLRHCTSANEYSCGFPEALLGALIVEAVATPFGVHIVHRKGSLRRELLASAAYTLGLGAVGIATIHYTLGSPVLLIPIAHIAHTIAMERRAALRELDRNQSSR